MSTAAVEPAGPEHEVKLITPALRAPSIVAWLSGRCPPDPLHPDGLVRSLYYDSRDVALLRAKINSDFLKHKVRVRWYADPATGKPGEPAFVELKRKVGGRRFKVRRRIEGAVDLLSRRRPPTAPLLTLLAPLRADGHLLPTDLQPFLRIGFRRRRFVDPTTGLRVAVDSDIRAECVNPGLLPLRHPGALAHAVIEIKGAHATVPRWLAPLRDLGCRRESFSKYARCYQKIARRSSF